VISDIDLPKWQENQPIEIIKFKDESGKFTIHAKNTLLNSQGAKIESMEMKDEGEKIRLIAKKITIAEKFKKITVESIEIAQPFIEKQEIKMKNVYIEALKKLKIGSIIMTNGVRVVTTENTVAEIDYLQEIIKGAMKNPGKEGGSSKKSNNGSLVLPTEKKMRNDLPRITNEEYDTMFFNELKENIAESKKKRKEEVSVVS